MAKAKKRTRGPDKKPRKKRVDKPDTPKLPAGPGRPKGSTNALSMGEVAAIRSLRWRVPDQVPQPLKDVADEAFDTVVEVMRAAGRHDKIRLSAARTVREEVCGPIPRTLDYQGVTINVVTGVPRNPDDPDVE